MNRCKEETKLL